MEEVREHLVGLGSYWGTWVLGSLLLTANVLGRLRGREAAGAVAFLLAAQFFLADGVRAIHLMVFTGSMLSHAGPVVTWSRVLSALAAWGILFLGGALPLVTRLFDPRVRDAVRSLRWTFGALGISAVSSVLVALGYRKMLFP
jgi:hypothetical protein